MISKLRIKQSLSLKVLTINIVFAIFIATIIGIFVQNRVASTVINEKISISKVEAAGALYSAQRYFKLARFKDDKELNKVIQDFIALSREDGFFSGRETVILPIPNLTKNQSVYQTVPTLLVLDSISEKFREQVTKNEDVSNERITISYSDGKDFPGFIIGTKLNIPRSGTYEIYYLLS